MDPMRPEIGFASLALLEEAGCRVEVPRAQTRCGQPAYNSGDDAGAASLARQVVAAFEPYDHTVAPSGPCAATIRQATPSSSPTTPPGPRARKRSRASPWTR
jgi:L-lactate dehydrogenase complex protein LldE